MQFNMCLGGEEPKLVSKHTNDALPVPLLFPWPAMIFLYLCAELAPFPPLVSRTSLRELLFQVYKQGLCLFHSPFEFFIPSSSVL